ncbi:ABC transporter substrate-binding protein [Streptomyces sp. SCSIO 75703]|uniref:ABC transporter substrate-binding protein n=1 Tax=unclassified Streptomyces TaxID=2593676 RepID=UPI00068F523C|nr:MULTISPECIES: ABC transporter substrate-binding protein [unclassified Streptomyces]
MAHTAHPVWLRRLTALAGAAALTLTAAACGSSPAGGDAKRADGRTKVRIAVIPTVTKAPMYLGIEKGFFAEEGLDVEPTVVQDGAAVTAAVVSGQAEFASSALAPTAVAAAKQLPIKIVMTAASTSAPDSATTPYGDAVLVVREDSPITSVADLNGKTIAVNALKAGLELAVRGAVDRLGGDSSTLKFLTLPFPEMATALEQKRVDAIAPVEPFVSSAVADGARVLHHTYPFDPAQQPEFVNSVYFTGSRYAAEHGDVVKAFARAIAKSNAYAADHPDEVRAVLPKYTGVKAQAAKTFALPDYPATLNKAAYQSEIDLMVRYGFIDKPLDTSSLYTQ